MTVPAMGNLLIRAFKLVGFTPIEWYASTGRTTTAIGTLVSTFAEPETVQAQVQPVSRELIQFLGLDAQKEYITIYAPQKMDDVTRDRSGDQIVFSAYRYAILSNTEWFSIQGWNGQVAVKIAKAT
jgi:hypothetical protein